MSSVKATTFIWVLVLVTLGCTEERRSSSGFRLPDGDAARGRAVFAEMKCHTCHRVYQHDEFPKPAAEPSVPVSIGGRYARVPGDGELVTSIINPSHKISSRYAHTLVTAGASSRMGDFGDSMTIRDLIDVVAFLHTVYEHDESMTQPDWPHGGP